MHCPQCGSSNDDSAKYCAHCGQALTQGSRDLSQAPSEKAAVADKTDLYRALIGPNNQSYYLNVFERFDRRGRAGMSWHWPAFFVTFYWFLYRKMWWSALGYLVLPYVAAFFLAMIVALLGIDSDVTALGIYVSYLAGIWLLPALCANELYYKQCNRIIARVKARSTNDQRVLGELAGRGGTSNVAIFIVIVVATIALISILAAIAIPAYQEYTVRARVSEAYATGDLAAQSVGHYFREHQVVPASLEAAGFSTSLPSSIKDISLDSSNGLVIMTMANQVIEDKHLVLVPSLDSDGQVNWTCMSRDIPERYLPKRCRQPQ